MEKILVLDFGGQYNQLIARRVRDHHVYAEILPYTTDIEIIKQNNYKGIIFTGGPNSVYDMASPHYTKDILNIGVPILGICYGCQLIAWMGNGEVKTAPQSEYGKIEFTKKDSKLFKDVDEKSIVCMSIQTIFRKFQMVLKLSVLPMHALAQQCKIQIKIFMLFNFILKLHIHSLVLKCFITSFMKFAAVSAIGLWITLLKTQ